MFLQEFRCIKEISVPPWKIKRCTLVKRNLLGNGDYPHSVCVCISQANPHPPVDIFPKKDTAQYMPYLLFFNVFAGGCHCVCVFVGSVLLLWRSVENAGQPWHSKQQCGAILSASFYQTIYSFLVLDSGEWGKENLPSIWPLTCAVSVCIHIHGWIRTVVLVKGCNWPERTLWCTGETVKQPNLRNSKMSDAKWNNLSKKPVV